MLDAKQLLAQTLRVIYPARLSLSAADHEMMQNNRTISEIIAEQTRLRPEGTALVAESVQLSYGEMDLRSAQLANHLRSFGAGRGVLVGIGVERSTEFVVAALAIMRSGAAYLPMDPTNPAERLQFMVKDGGVRLIITQGKHAGLFENSDIQVIDLEAEKNAIAQQPSQLSEIEAGIDELAYVIYTSGSTGEPKGVEITHRNLANLIAWHVRAFMVDSSARATFLAGVGFDAAVWEIWPALSVGAQLHLPAEETRLSPEALRDWLVAREITHSFVPTIMAEELIALSWPDETRLRFLLTGADTLHRFPPRGLPFALVNNYGPTECTVVTTSAIIPPAGDGIPSIGAAIDNVVTRIVDGEIYVGGAGVARGYRNRPDITAERFVTDNGERFYRTGDLGRVLSNGEIAFLGRRDDQIKIRGFRIEPNEINAAINSHLSVKSSVVIAREDSPNEKKLVAYIVPRNSFHDEAALRESIAERLPDYMMPNAFVWLKSLPLTANGKVNRAALPLPSGCAEDFIAPRTPVEETLAGIISEVLKVPRLGVHDDFFHLGAHSLLGAQIIARVRDVFGAQLRLLDVFDAPTVAELSVRIEDALTTQLNAMSEEEVEATLAALDGAALRSPVVSAVRTARVDSPSRAVS